MYALTANYYLGAASAVIAAVTVATGIHFLVEKPTNELGRRLSRRMRTRASLGDREPVAPVAPVAAMLDPVDQVGTSTASA